MANYRIFGPPGVGISSTDVPSVPSAAPTCSVLASGLAAGTQMTQAPFYDALGATDSVGETGGVTAVLIDLGLKGAKSLAGKEELEVGM